MSKAYLIVHHTYTRGAQPYAVCVTLESAKALKRELEATVEDMLEEYEIKELEMVL